MKDELYKEALKVNNEKYMNSVIQEIIDVRQPLITEINSLYEEFSGLNKYWKYIHISEYILYLSFYNDNEVNQILEKFGLKMFTSKLYVDYTNIFKALKEHENSTTLLYPYQQIIGFYYIYSSAIIKEAICKDLDVDLTKITAKINRQYKAGNIPELLEKQVEKFKELKLLFDEGNIFTFFKEKNPFTSISHSYKFSHKTTLRNLYNSLLELNIKAEYLTNESDLKVEFYDLLEIILRDKSILNNSEDIQLTYGEPGSRRFKIKRINSLILK